MSYQEKYLKYKKKYLDLKILIGGGENIESDDDYRHVLSFNPHVKKSDKWIKGQPNPVLDRDYTPRLNFKDLISQVKKRYNIYFDNISNYIMQNLNDQDFNSLDTDMADRFISAITKLINDDINYLTYSGTIKSFKEYLAIFIIDYNKIIEQFFGNNNLLSLTRNFFSETSILSINSSSNVEHTSLQSPFHSQSTHTTTLRSPLERNPYIDRSQSPFDSQVNPLTYGLKESHNGRW